MVGLYSLMFIKWVSINIDSQYHELSTLIGHSHHQEIPLFLRQTFTNCMYGKWHVVDVSLNETA